jgi:hypothetical protein
MQLKGLNCALFLQVETDHVIKDGSVKNWLKALLIGPEPSQKFAYVIVDQMVLEHSYCLRRWIVEHFINRTIFKKFRFYHMVLRLTIKTLMCKRV